MNLVAPLEVGIAVDDLELMLPFYRDVLGFRYVAVDDVAADKGAASTLCARGYRIVRLQTSTGERIKLAEPAITPRTLDSGEGDVLRNRGPAFLTFIVKDLDEMLRHLAGHGVKLRTGQQPVEIREGVYLAFAEDPEGNYLEFVEYADIAAYRPDLHD